MTIIYITSRINFFPSGNFYLDTIRFLNCFYVYVSMWMWMWMWIWKMVAHCSIIVLFQTKCFSQKQDCSLYEMFHKFQMLKAEYFPGNCNNDLFEVTNQSQIPHHIRWL